MAAVPPQKSCPRADAPVQCALYNNADAWTLPGAPAVLLPVAGLCFVAQQPLLGVQRGRAARSRRGDRLPVDMVDHVAGGKNTRDVGHRVGMLHLDIALFVEVELTLDEFVAGVVADGPGRALRGRGHGSHP